jgi:hypothetical protein
MDSRRVGRCRGFGLATIAFASALLVSAEAASLYGAATLADSTVAPSAVEQLRSSTAPLPVAISATDWGTRAQPNVRVAWYDVEGFLHADFDLVAAQVTAFFRKAGVTLVWRRGEIRVSTQDVAVDELPVIILGADTSASRGARPVFGTTMMSRSGSRTVTVFLDPIHETLGLHALRQTLSPMELHQRAQAVARVIAHELVHALAPGQAHCAHGLMKCALSHADILSPLSSGEAQAVRAMLSATGYAATAPRGPQPARN